jgi:protein-tyrosine phosphatase
MRVLFVCTGNICRSPAAEGVFRRLLDQDGLSHRVTVDSAGTGDWHLGEPPDPRAQAAARRRGIDISGMRARRLAASDFRRSDLMLAMDRGHLRALERAAPAGARAELRLFLDTAPELGRAEVPDPYYEDEPAFEAMFDLIEAGCRGLLASLRARLG